MSLILSGTDGLSDVDGSAATPAIRGTDANTGIFFPAADTIAFSEGGVEAMRIDSSGRVGIGTDSIGANYKLSVNGTGNFYQSVSGLGRIFLGDPADSSGYIGLYRSDLGPANSTTAGNGLNFASISGYTFNTGAGVAFGSQTERMRIDSSGNVGIGTSSPLSKLQVVADQASYTNDVAQLIVSGTNTNKRLYLGFNTTGDKAFIQATNVGVAYKDLVINPGGGDLLVGTTSTANSSNTIFRTSGAGNPCLTLFKNSAANTDNAFCIGNGSGGFTNSFIVLANGNALNTNNSYGAISDVRLKENIQDATPKLADLMQVKIRQYNLVADEEKQKQLGVVADELEAVFPAMVAEGDDGFKNVKYSVFVPMLIKAIQEQQALIQSLTTRITALETP
jgi:chorismate mutase